MRIPKRFKILGKTISVHDDPMLRFTENADGMAYYVTNKIALQTDLPEYPLLNREQIFIHELLHHCLDAMGEQELRGNEKFVDLLSKVLHQAVTTMEYE